MGGRRRKRSGLWWRRESGDVKREIWKAVKGGWRGKEEQKMGGGCEWRRKEWMWMRWTAVCGGGEVGAGGGGRAFSGGK